MHLSRLGLLVHLVASLPWWHPSTSALPWHGSILGVRALCTSLGCVHLVDWARMGYICGGWHWVGGITPPLA